MCLVGMQSCEANEESYEGAVEAEAHQAMEAWGAAIRDGDADRILTTYSKAGVTFATKGTKYFTTFEELANQFGVGDLDPQDFEWEGLSFEVLSPDAVLVTGSFRLRWLEDEGVRGSNMVLLVREEGELRVRAESESLTNLGAFAWCRDGDWCESPLGYEERERYVGEYELGSLRFRVFVEADRLMIEGPFEISRNRLLPYGDHQFRLDSVPDLRLVFDSSGERASYFHNFRDVFFGTPRRIETGAAASGR